MSVEVRQVRSTVWKRHATQTAAARAMGVTGGRLSNYLNRAGGSKLVPGVDAINGHVARRGAGDDGSESEADDSESEDEADGAEEGDASGVAASAAAGEAPSADAAAAAAGCGLVAAAWRRFLAVNSWEERVYFGSSSGRAGKGASQK